MQGMEAIVPTLISIEMIISIRNRRLGAVPAMTVYTLGGGLKANLQHKRSNTIDQYLYSQYPCITLFLLPIGGASSFR